MCKETKFTGVKSDILPTIQSMVDAIKPPIIMSTDEFKNDCALFLGHHLQLVIQNGFAVEVQGLELEEHQSN